MSWKLRGCPHCGGDIIMYEDENRIQVENCLQCGYNAAPKKVERPLETVKSSKKSGIREPSLP